MAYIKDLSAFFVKILEKQEKNETLDWHDNTIPEDEIWVKIGGDRGKSSFKIALQICNVLKPNSISTPI